MPNLLAQNPQTPLPGGFTGIGNISNPNNAELRMASVISVAIGLITIIAGIWFLIQIIISGLQWISSKGDKQGLAAVQARMTHAVVGLLVVVLAYAIVSIIGRIIGFPILNLAGLLLSLTIP